MLISQHKQGDLVALLAGAVLPLAYSPFDLYPIAIISTALLFVLWLEISPKRAFVRGFVFGLGMFSTGVTWIYVSIHDFGYVNHSLSILLTVLFVMVLSLFPAIAGYLASRIISATRCRSRNMRLILVFPACWTLMEWVKGWFFTGFPWLSLGYSQIDAPLGGLASFVGVYGISLATAISAALLIATFGNQHGRVRGGHLVALVGLWAVAVLTGMVAWTQPSGNPLRVSLVQGNIAQDFKWLPQMKEPTFELYRQMTRQNWDSDLVIWPETALPAYYDEAASFLRDLAIEARENSTDILVGLVYQEEQGLKYYNSMVSIGSVEAMYHKHHLVPFTEYLPLKEVLAGIIDFMDVPMSDFSAGKVDQPLLEVAGQKIAMSICYEDAFGEETIVSLPAANLLVNVSNDAWFGTSIAPYQHLQIARMRARETGRAMLRATNTGLTAIIGHNGNLLSLAPQFQESVLTGTAQPRQGSTPYVMVGNSLVLLLIAAMLITAAICSRAQKSRDTG
ncbi:MAG: apolipoprotein N-acyltransferase [Gammaproteobacteria bacterium]